jgi:hypothetical protein
MKVEGNIASNEVGIISKESHGLKEKREGWLVWNDRMAGTRHIYFN